VVGSDLSVRPRVELVDADSASGLADLLHQFLEQTVEASEDKSRRARALRGDVVVRAAEDEDVAVRIAFLGDRIELADLGARRVAAPSIQGDFLTVAHVTSGQASPLSLVLRRRLRVSFRLGELPFLLRVMSFMRIDDGAAKRGFPALAFAAALAAAVLLALVLYFWLRP
jgi:hypothetical protein